MDVFEKKIDKTTDSLIVEKRIICLKDQMPTEFRRRSKRRWCVYEVS